MLNSKAYIIKKTEWRMPVIFKRVLQIFFCMSLLFVSASLYAQDETDYDELLIQLNVTGVGSSEINSIIKGEELYLPVADLFDFLKIRCVPSATLDSVSGFFIDEESEYLIDRSKNKIVFQGKEYLLQQGDIILTETGLYLKTTYFGQVFGLDCKFSFRNLSVNVQSKLELPVIHEMKQQEMRKNIKRLKGEFKTDTTIGRTYPGFYFGAADWSVINTIQTKGENQTNLNLSLGAMIAGGEASASLYYRTAEPFTEKQQSYKWRYVNNDNAALRQITAGKIATQATSSVYNPVVGVQLTNTPTTFRRSFGTYTLSDKTEPGWLVELYVNNVLVDYVKADASGFFTFQVPLVYGNTIVQLKFYGPWGEEKTKEQNISIPFNFLPQGTFEYTAGAGVVEDTLSSIFARASFGYGATRGLTIGGGMEYLSSVSSGPAMPYISASLKVTNNLILSGEFTYGVRSKAVLSYRTPSNIQLDINYIKYDKGQTAIRYNYLEERKATLSFPIKKGNFFAFNRLSVNQIVLPTTKYTTGEWMFSVPVFGINTNLSTYALFIGQNNPNIYSNLALSLKMPAGFMLYPQAQYSYTENELISAKLRLERRIFNNGYLNMSYEQNLKSSLKSGEIGLRYDFSFAQVGASARRSNDMTSLVQYARGSLINDRKTKFLGADKYVNVGKGGITVLPYLDLNANGKRDKGETKVHGLNLHASSGRMERSDRDSTIRILGLEPYTTCYLELDSYSFDNISWRLKQSTYAVIVDPNKIKLIEVPVSVYGEANGTIVIDEKGMQRGVGRIIVDFYTKDMKPAGRTLSESDGYFSYLGFAPGEYVAKVDSAQLRRLKFRATPETKLFVIKKDIDGDIVDGLDFTLFRVLPDTTAVKDTTAVIAGDTLRFIVPDTAATVKQTVKTDTTVMIIHEVTKEVVSSSTDEFTIQIGAFRRKSNAEALKKRLSAVLDKKVEIITEDGFYKVRVTGFESKEDLNSYIPVLKKYGVTEMWIVNTTVKKQDVVIKTVQDTIATVVSVTETELIPGVRKELGIQLGAFKEKRWATQLRNKTKGLTDKDVEMIYEDGFYKVRIKGLTDLKEMESLMPMLFENGYKDVWILPFNERIEVPSNPAMLRHVFKTELAPLANAVPTVALQVGAFYKKHDAVKAQKKIAKGTGRNVVMKKQWDYYTLFVTGFYTKESTYKYYPEIAGLGYPEIYLVQNYYDY